MPGPGGGTVSDLVRVGVVFGPSTVRGACRLAVSEAEYQVMSIAEALADDPRRDSWVTDRIARYPAAVVYRGLCADFLDNQL